MWVSIIENNLNGLCRGSKNTFTPGGTEIFSAFISCRGGNDSSSNPLTEGMRISMFDKEARRLSRGNGLNRDMRFNYTAEFKNLRAIRV